MIPEEKIAEVRQSATISDFISPHVTLKRKGRAQMGLCPFHNEKTPSFSVNDENGFYHCFGCGVSGDVAAAPADARARALSDGACR